MKLFISSNEDEFADELKALGLEDSGADVKVACYTEKQKFRYNSRHLAGLPDTSSVELK